MDAQAREKLKLWLPVVLWALVIFAVSQIPNLRSPFGSRLARKLAHVAEYLVFSALLSRAFFGSGLRRSWWALAAGCACAFAASDEFHQLFVHGRHASIKDFYIDSLGAALGLAVYGLALLGADRGPAGGSPGA
jgi:VanZ family protein